jgi:hypothetical protein
VLTQCKKHEETNSRFTPAEFVKKSILHPHAGLSSVRFLDVVRLMHRCLLNLSGRSSVGWRWRGDS